MPNRLPAVAAHPEPQRCALFVCVCVCVYRNLTHHFSKSELRVARDFFMPCCFFFGDVAQRKQNPHVSHVTQAQGAHPTGSSKAATEEYTGNE